MYKVRLEDGKILKRDYLPNDKVNALRLEVNNIYERRFLAHLNASDYATRIFNNFKTQCLDIQEEYNKQEYIFIFKNNYYIALRLEEVN